MISYIRINFLNNFLCWFGVMHLYYNDLSNSATNSLLMFELFPPLLSCSKNFTLKHTSLELSERKMFLNPDANLFLLLKFFL